MSLPPGGPRRFSKHQHNTLSWHLGPSFSDQTIQNNPHLGSSPESFCATCLLPAPGCSKRGSCAYHTCSFLSCKFQFPHGALRCFHLQIRVLLPSLTRPISLAQLSPRKLKPSLRSLSNPLTPNILVYSSFSHTYCFPRHGLLFHVFPSNLPTPVCLA
ncbi:hypothetical protein VUR80DRAFT_6369 [Thermomyces stellatus]